MVLIWNVLRLADCKNSGFHYDSLPRATRRDATQGTYRLCYRRHAQWSVSDYCVCVASSVFVLSLLVTVVHQT